MKVTLEEKKTTQNPQDVFLKETLQHLEKDVYVMYIYNTMVEGSFILNIKRFCTKSSEFKFTGNVQILYTKY